MRAQRCVALRNAASVALLRARLWYDLSSSSPSATTTLPLSVISFWPRLVASISMLSFLSYCDSLWSRIVDRRIISFFNHPPWTWKRLLLPYLSSCVWWGFSQPPAYHRPPCQPHAPYSCNNYLFNLSHLYCITQIICLPFSVTNLILTEGEGFNLHNSIIHLSFGFNFNYPVDMLPQGLLSLSVGFRFN